MQKVSKSGVKRDYKPVEVVEIFTNFKSVAHLQQDIESIYPGRRMSNNKSTGLFDQPDDGQKFNVTRHCLIAIPEGTTVEQVASQLSKNPNGVIQRVVTNNIQDVLTDGDVWAMKNRNPETNQPYATLESLKEKYETRDKEGNRYSAGQMRISVTGEIINDSLPEEFTRNFYQREYTEDLDLREKVTVEETAETSVLVS